MNKNTRWAILVIWDDGSEEYLKQGVSASAQIARFNNRANAIEQAKFMKMGMDDCECQSINVVPYPQAGGGQ